MKRLKDYIIFDIETTGFSPTNDRCTEIGAIKVIDGKVIATFNALLNWNIPIPAKITELTTIDKPLLDKEGIDPQKAVNEFVKFLGEDLVVMGHNILRFDVPFINGNFNQILRPIELKRGFFDTAALYKMKKLGIEISTFTTAQDMLNILNQRHSVKYSIDTACIEFNIDKSKVTQHRAVGDCHLTKIIYENLCELDS